MTLDIPSINRRIKQYISKRKLKKIIILKETKIKPGNTELEMCCELDSCKYWLQDEIIRVQYTVSKARQGRIALLL